MQSPRWPSAPVMFPLKMASNNVYVLSSCTLEAVFSPGVTIQQRFLVCQPHNLFSSSFCLLHFIFVYFFNSSVVRVFAICLLDKLKYANQEQKMKGNCWIGLPVECIIWLITLICIILSHFITLRYGCVPSEVFPKVMGHLQQLGRSFKSSTLLQAFICLLFPYKPVVEVPFFSSLVNSYCCYILCLMNLQVFFATVSCRLN